MSDDSSDADLSPTEDYTSELSAPSAAASASAAKPPPPAAEEVSYSSLQMGGGGWMVKQGGRIKTWK